MEIDISSTILRLSVYIRNIHLRDVRRPPESFVETIYEHGVTGMAAAMRAFSRSATSVPVKRQREKYRTIHRRTVITTLTRMQVVTGK